MRLGLILVIVIWWGVGGAVSTFVRFAKLRNQYFPKTNHKVKKSWWTKDLFNVGDRHMGFKVIEYEKTIDMFSDSISQQTLKKFPLKECWCSTAPQKKIHNYLKRLPRSLSLLQLHIHVNQSLFPRAALSCSVVSDSVTPRTTRLRCPWGSPGKNTAAGCHALTQGIFLTQGSNPGLPHGRQILYHLSPQGSPRILEWVAYRFSRASSWPRNQTGGFFTSWATMEVLSF